MPPAPPTSRPSTWPSPGPTWCSTPTTPSGSTSSRASLYLTGDGTIVSAASMGAGTIYTVVSDDITATAQQLRDATCPRRRDPAGTPTGSRPTEESPLPPTPPPLPAGRGPGPAITAGIGIPGDTDPHTYDKVEAIEQWMADPRHLHHRHPAAGPRGRRRRQLPVRQPARLLRADLDRHGGHAADPRHRRPRDGRATSRAPTTRSPTSTTCRPRTPTPGCRCGSPGTAGRTSIPPPTCRWPTPSPARSWPARAGHVLGPPALDPHRDRARPWSARSCCGPAPRLRRPPTWAHQVAADLERGGLRLGRQRRVDETLTAYGERLAQADPAHADDLLWTTGLVERCTYGGVEPSADEIAAGPGLHPALPVAGGRPSRHHRSVPASGPGQRPRPRRTRRRRPAAAGRPSAGGAG